jgi:hypothetical protein
MNIYPGKPKQEAKIPDVWQNKVVLPRKMLVKPRKTYNVSEGHILRIEGLLFWSALKWVLWAK